MKPVYVINGFLDSGKTEFIKFTLAQPYFRIKGNTLLVLCEEGEVEYDELLLKKTRTIIEKIENEEDFTPERLTALEKKHKAERIIVEFNGMWNYREVKFPWYWQLEQQITCVDASTFSMYLANMRSLATEMLRKSELVIFNRCDNVRDQLSTFKRGVMAVNREAEIVFEDANGQINEMMEEELPYDLNAPVMDLTDQAYCIWFMDIMDHPERYEGKCIRFLATAFIPEKMDPGYFVPGRMVMTCCANDVTYLGYVCKYDELEGFEPENKAWYILTCRIHRQYWEDYKGEGPVMTLLEAEKAPKPKQDVINFV